MELRCSKELEHNKLARSKLWLEHSRLVRSMRWLEHSSLEDGAPASPRRMLTKTASSFVRLDASGELPDKNLANSSTCDKPRLLMGLSKNQLSTCPVRVR